MLMITNFAALYGMQVSWAPYQDYVTLIKIVPDGVPDIFAISKYSSMSVVDQLNIVMRRQR